MSDREIMESKPNWNKNGEYHCIKAEKHPPTITPEEFVWYARGLMDSALSALARQRELNQDSTIKLIPTLDKLFRKLNQVK